jgi:glycosyltransferase involved in cell wall biosynthesis
MPTIGLDATYIVDAKPTGTATYCRSLVRSLALLGAPHRFLVCYRLSRFKSRRQFREPLEGISAPNFSVQPYQPPLTFWLPWQVDVFHNLGQRPPAFRFKREVVTVHDVFPISGGDYSTPDFQRKFSALLRKAVERADRIITLSEYTASQVVLHCGVERSRIRVVPGGIWPETQVLSPGDAARERDRVVGDGHEMLLMVGVIDNRKNVVNALRALQLLPPRYRLVLAGGNGYGSEAVHGFIASQRLEERVKVLGYVASEALAALYRSASALLFPSLEEGFGFPVLEAMVRGLPVVTSNTSSLPEVGGDSALYADPRDPHSIAGEVTRAVEDLELRRELIRKGALRSCEFTWERTARETLRVYEDLLG